MAKFDIGKITEKLDIQKLMTNVKAIMNPGSAVPEGIIGNPMATKIAIVHEELHQLADTIGGCSKKLAELNNIVGSLYKDLEAAKVEVKEAVAEKSEEKVE